MIREAILKKQQKDRCEDVCVYRKEELPAILNSQGRSHWGDNGTKTGKEGEKRQEVIRGWLAQALGPSKVCPDRRKDWRHQGVNPCWDKRIMEPLMTGFYWMRETTEVPAMYKGCDFIYISFKDHRVVLSPRLQYSGRITAHCSLYLLASSSPPSWASQMLGLQVWVTEPDLKFILDCRRKGGAMIKTLSQRF